MLRVDSQRFIAQFRSINPMYQPLKLDSLSQITITGTKLVYSCNKTLDNSMDTVSCCSSTSASLSSTSSPCRYAILSSCHIKKDLVLSLPEIHVDVKLPERVRLFFMCLILQCQLLKLSLEMVCILS